MNGLEACCAWRRCWCFGVLPFWERLRPRDFVLALLALLALMAWKLPPWLVVLASAAAGWLLAL